MSIADENLIFASDGIMVAKLKSQFVIEFKVDTWAHSETLENLSFRVVRCNIYGFASRDDRSKSLLYPRKCKFLVVSKIGAESQIGRRHINQSSLRQEDAMREDASCCHVETLYEAKFDVVPIRIAIALIGKRGDHEQEAALHEFELALSFSLNSEALASFKLLEVSQVTPYGPSRGDLFFEIDAASDVDNVLCKNINDCHLKKDGNRYY